MRHISYYDTHPTKCYKTLFAQTVKSKDNFDACKLSQEKLFLKLINPASKSIREIAEFVSDCLEKRTQAISALASNS